MRAPTARVGDGEATVTAPTGGRVTCSVAVAVRPLLIAVTVAVPAASARATPPASTDTIAGALEFQVMAAAFTGAPSVSNAVTTKVSAPPMGIDAAAGASWSLVTPAGRTVTVAEPMRPSMLAVTVAIPTERPRSSALPSTVATAPLVLAHCTVRPETAVPRESVTLTVSGVRPPTSSCTAVGVMVTAATVGVGGVGGSAASPRPPPHADANNAKQNEATRIHTPISAGGTRDITTAGCSGGADRAPSPASAPRVVWLSALMYGACS